MNKGFIFYGGLKAFVLFNVVVRLTAEKTECIYESVKLNVVQICLLVSSSFARPVARRKSSIESPSAAAGKTHSSAAAAASPPAAANTG